MMRTKAQILKDSLEAQSKKPYWDNPNLLLAPLTIEILIDIRDQLTALTTILGSVKNISFRPG